jgi:hypothetical protein
MDGAQGGDKLVHYVRPEVKDYGDLVSITADGAGMAHLGFGTLAAMSSPVGPTGNGGNVLPANDSSVTPTTPGGGGDGGGVAGDVASGGDSGGDAGGGSGGGSGGVAGAGAAKLAFTGFAAAAVGMIGAGLTGAGAAARKYLARR